MAAEVNKEIQLEIAHVLFVDIAGYSKVMINEQRALLETLSEVVRGTDEFQSAEAAGRLIKIPTGDGMALVFYNSQEEPVECALEMSRALRKHPELHLRMGIHSGPVSGLVDLNGRANVAGAGINLAQRVMDCGDAGHILLSKRIAEDLEQYGHWRPHLHDLGECEVKHGVRLQIVNLYTDELGNPELPEKFKSRRPGKFSVPLFGSKARPRTLFVALILVAATLITGALVFSHRSASRSADSNGAKSTSTAAPIIPEKSIAVLPFANMSANQENAFFADGVQDEILTNLAKIADLKVISRTSVMQYRDTAKHNVREIAQQLGVAHLLEGSVQRAGNNIRVTAQLIDARTDAHQWAEHYDRKLTDVFAVESEIAKTVAGTLQAKLTGSADHVLASRPTENPEAHDLYLKGRYLWNKRTTENLKKAIDYFEQAIGKDPAYALAYSGLADVHAVLPYYAATSPKDDAQKALAAARKAVGLDESLAEAHTSLANALVLNLQFSASVPEFKRAIELNPNYATAHEWYGEELQNDARFDEAVAELKRAQELDPLSLVINSVLGSSLAVAGRDDEAIEQLRKTIEMDPTFDLAHWFLGQVYEDKNQLGAAIPQYERATQLSPDPAVQASLARAYAMTGRKGEARKILDSLTTTSRQRYIPAYSLAVVHLSLGDKEEALRLLEKSYEDRAPFDTGVFGSIKIDRRLDPLRGDPRFEALARKVMSGAAPETPLR